MCGITGFISLELNGDLLHETANCMSQKLFHRGPDNDGIWCDPKIGIALAHRRLSIVDLTKNGHQPMNSHCGRYCIVFNGEIYNHLFLRKELPDSIIWIGNSDTETLLNCISYWGIEKTLTKIVGMFAFAIWDRNLKKLTLVRDRIGEKPLYFGTVGKTLLFGSELKAIKAFPNFSPNIDRDSLQLYLKFGYVPAPYSIYKNIYKLMPGNFIEFSLEDIELKKMPSIKKYWSLELIASQQEINPYQGSESDAINHLDNLLKESISGQLLGDVQIGAFLSGGLDSSTVVSIMQKLSSQPINTFSVGFNEFGFDESKKAKAIASFLGTNHNEVVLTSSEAIKIIPLMPEIYDEPFADVSQIPTFLLSKFASSKVKVCLSGDGGDELFCGYYRQIMGPKIWRILNKIPMPFKKIIASFINYLPPTTWDNFYYICESLIPNQLRISSPGLKLQKLTSLINSETLFEVYLSLVSAWSSSENIILNAKKSNVINNFDFENYKLNNHHHYMMFLDSINYLPNDIMVKVDRAAMHSSLETRMPILDHRIMEFSWRIPINLKIRDNSNKWLLRQVLKKYLPMSLVKGPKEGFSVPISKWLRGPLKEWANDLLDPTLLKNQEYFAVDPIINKWHEHLSGKHDWSFQLWTTLMFQEWINNQ